MKSLNKYFNISYLYFTFGLILISLLSLYIYGRGVYDSNEKRLENINFQIEAQTINGIRNARNNLLIAETLLRDYALRKKVLDKDYVGKILASAIFYNRAQKDVYFAVSKKYLSGLQGNPKGILVLAARKKIDQFNYSIPKIVDSSFINNYDITVYEDDIYLKSEKEVWYNHPVKNKGHLTYVPPYFDATYLKEWLFTLSRAVYDESNELIGVVGIDYLLTSSLNVFKSYLGEWGVIFFQTQDGKILFESREKGEKLVKVLPGYKETIFSYIGDFKTINENLASIQHKKINNQWIVYRLTRLKEFPWTIMIYRSAASFYAPVIPFALILTAVVLFMLLGFIFYLKHIQNEFLPVIDNFMNAIKRDVKFVKENRTISGKYDESSILEISEIIKCINQLFEVVNENFVNYQRELEKNKKINSELEDLVTKKTEQLIQKEKMAALGVMTAGIAHEIKNPLNLICSTAEIITMQLDKIEMSGLVKDNDILEKLERIKNSNKILTANGKRVDNIVRTLLMQTRTGNSAEKEKILLEDVIQSSLDFILVINRPKINNQIRVSYTKPDDKVFVMANPVNLGRVFINIFDNSIYAITKKLGNSPYNAELKINIKEVNNMVEVRIRDNGIGMNQEQLKNAYTPFYTSKPAGEGTGLGLSFAYENVRELGGNLDLISKENEFTEIVITLPIKEKV